MRGDRPGTATQLSRVPYLPGLDGLRAVAVVAVMVYHANHGWLGGGFLGVEVFFVISGYLITLLLIGEQERHGSVNLGQFWLRRARRLLPALFVMLAGLAVYMTLFERDPLGRTRGDFLGGIFYVSNWYQIFVGQGYADAGAFAPLRHLWSLAVEEQFYLLWPLVMIVILRRGRRNLPRVGLWLAGVSVAIAVVTAGLFASGDVANVCSPSDMHGYWKLFGRCVSVNDTLYLGTITRAGGLMLGAGFAMLWRPVAIMRGPLRNKGRLLDLLAVVGLAVLALLVWKITLSRPGDAFGTRFDPWLFRGGFLWTGIATLLLIAAVTHRGALAGRAIGNPVLTWIGTRSYGLYLFHWPIYQIIRTYAGVALTGRQFVLAMAITLPVTELSYRFVETPIRTGRLTAWFRGRAASDPAPMPGAAARPIMAFGAVALALLAFSVFSVVTAENKCVGDVECSLVQAGAEPTTPGSSVPTTASTPDTTDGLAGVVDPVATTAPETVPTTAAPTTAPLPPPDLLAFGESVMLGAKAQLEKGGFVVDAQESRQASGMIAEITARRAAGGIGPVVVIQVGTNGTVTDDEFRQIVELLPNSEVYFLTVKANVPWIDGNNQRIFGLPATYGAKVHVIDWKGRSAEIADQLSKEDGGVHLRGTKAQQFYANMIFDNIGRSELDVVA